MAKSVVDGHGPPAERDAGQLALDRETMRELGYRTVDMLVDRLVDESAPPLRRATPEEMAERLGGPPPAEPQALRRAPPPARRGRARRSRAAATTRASSPSSPSCGTWPGALGDFIASACNVYAGSWMEAAGPTQLELEVLDWFRDWIGLPGDAPAALS